MDHYLKAPGKKHFLWAGLANLVEYELELREDQLDNEVNSEVSRNQNTDSFDIICTLRPSHACYKIV